MAAMKCQRLEVLLNTVNFPKRLQTKCCILRSLKGSKLRVCGMIELFGKTVKEKCIRVFSPNFCHISPIEQNAHS